MSTVHARETIGCSMVLLAEMLTSEHTNWLSSFLRLACMEGESVAVRAHADTLRPLPPTGPKTASVDLGRMIPHADGETVVLPIGWRLSGYRILPARFEGRLQLQRGGADSTEVEVHGAWVLDARIYDDFEARLAVKTAAEKTVGRFLANLRAALEEASRDTA